ncbi:MAG: restriction endonuclease subunit S [Pseudomarimonas sp.]
MHKSLDQLAEIRSGYSFRTGLTHEDDGPIGVLQIKDIKLAAPIDPASLTRIRWTLPSEPPFLRAGDIVLPARGEHYPATLLQDNAPLVASSQLYVLTPNTSRVLADYLCWVLNQKDARSYILKNRAGSSIPMLSVSALASLPVPVPSLPTQRRIANLHLLWQREHTLTQQLLETRRQILERVFHQLLES